MNSNSAEKFFKNVGRNGYSPFNKNSNGRGGSGSGSGGHMIGTKDGNSVMIKFLMWSLIGLLTIMVIVVVVFGVSYMMADCNTKKDFVDYLLNLDMSDVCVGGGVVPKQKTLVGQGSGEMAYEEREVKREDEVFLIGDQVYNYDEAKCKCNSYGAELATREQVIDSYNKGADSCLYGWSEGQNAFYTTQKCTWDKLQRGPVEERGKCGMPGVNGGYFANPYLKFGALCYGTRPEGEVVVEKKPVCNDKKPFCDKVKDLVEKRKGDKVVPFSGSKWSQWK